MGEVECGSRRVYAQRWATKRISTAKTIHSSRRGVGHLIKRTSTRTALIVGLYDHDHASLLSSPPHIFL